MTRSEPPDFVVVEPGPDSTVGECDLDAIACELADSARTVVRGWDVQSSGQLRPSPPVCVGVVSSEADAAAAVLAAISGARLAVLVTAPREVADRLCDDLRRLGTLDHRVGDSGVVVLSDDERTLLSYLLTGMTLGEAAAALHLSRRTADRRLASARRALAAGSTAEALQAAVHRGVRPTN